MGNGNSRSTRFSVMSSFPLLISRSKRSANETAGSEAPEAYCLQYVEEAERLRTKLGDLFQRAAYAPPNTMASSSSLSARLKRNLTFCPGKVRSIR